MRRSSGPGNECRQQTNWPRSKNNSNASLRHAGAGHAVDSDRKRLDERANLRA